MKRIMALTAVASLLALFALTSQAHAQEEATATADPAYVSEAGSHTITLSGSGWTNDVAIAECPGWGGAVPAEINEASVVGGCAPSVFAPTVASVSDGSFTQSVTVNVPAEGLTLFLFHQAPDAAAIVIIQVGEPMDDMGDDMGDDMAPEGAAETGFGGMAGSDGNSAAVPLAATIAAVTLLGGAVLVSRRHA